MTALAHAVLARNWSASTMELLIDAGSDVESRTLRGATPLMDAAYRGNAAAAQILLDAGARTDAADQAGWTPLHFAAQNERGLDILKMLILSDAAVDRPDSGGTTPLMIASAYNNPKAVAALLEARADPRRTDNTGRDSLSYARMKNAAECVSLLEDAASAP